MLSSPQAPPLQPHFCLLLPHTLISRCRLLFQRMTINPQSTLGVNHQIVTFGLYFTLPQSLKSLGHMSKINLRPQISFLHCASSFPTLPIIHIGDRGGKGILRAIPYYPRPKFSYSPFSTPITLHSISLLRSQRPHAVKISSRPKFHRMPQALTDCPDPSLPPPTSPFHFLPVLSAPGILVPHHPHAVGVAPMWASNPVHFPSVSVYILTISLPQPQYTVP